VLASVIIYNRPRNEFLEYHEKKELINLITKATKETETSRYDHAQSKGGTKPHADTALGAT